MESSRFDALAKALAGRRSRRAALRGGGAGLALGALGRTRVQAQEATPVAGGDEELLFVQTFAAGTWTPKAGDATVFELALTGSSGHTIYFANRPARDVGSIPTERFLDFLGFGPENPPNAALVVGSTEGEDVLVVELLNPRLEAGTLTYDARPLAEYQGQVLAGLAAWQGDQELSAAFGPGSLFIDAKRRGVASPASCRQQLVSCLMYEAGNLRELGNLGRYDMCQPRGSLCCRPCHASNEQLNNDCKSKFSNQRAYADWNCF